MSHNVQALAPIFACGDLMTALAEVQGDYDRTKGKGSFTRSAFFGRGLKAP